jgi:hypothetical protein
MSFELDAEDVEKVSETLRKRLQWFYEELERQQEELREEALEEVKEEAPVRTGTFRESIVAEGTDDEFAIFSTHPKAEQIVRGTGPSEGLYIKEAKGVGKRLTKRSGRKSIGMHPGTPRHPVFENAIERIVSLMERVLNALRKALRR